MKRQHLLTLLLSSALAISASASTERPGRVFFTPDERRALEQSRLRPTPAATPEQASIRFDGMIWRDRQLVRLWINQDAQRPQPPYHPELETAQLRIDTPAGQDARLTAGQQWPPADTAPRQETIRLQHGTRE
ncbi:MAG: hypothetical protein RBT39_16955 [Azoarcus sp.]|jgi:hypothetical protein|nr:hypothetical protein [Azoarcus sp.]MDD2872555.1 hypothetical protein [Azoarcus sp.]MDX9839252.1 hypothetical protein [Azoarcus sp.]